MKDSYQRLITQSKAPRKVEVTERIVVSLKIGVRILRQTSPDESSNMASLSAVEVTHAPQSVCANNEAPLNISTMLVTLDTSHSERSALKVVALQNPLETVQKIVRYIATPCGKPNAYVGLGLDMKK